MKSCTVGRIGRGLCIPQISQKGSICPLARPEAQRNAAGAGAVRAAAPQLMPGTLVGVKPPKMEKGS